MPSISEFRVRYAETDQMGVAYHANYLIWCEIGRTDYIRQHGLSYARMERDGLLLAVSEANVRFHASARYDELVREAEAMAGSLNKGKKGAGKTASGTRESSARREPELREIEQKLIEKLGTKVEVRGTGRKGRIEISYFSSDDLERLLEILA